MRSMSGCMLITAALLAAAATAQDVPAPAATKPAAAAPDFAGRVVGASDGVLRLGGSIEKPLLTLHANEPDYFYGPLVESETPVAINRILISSAPGRFWSGEIWGEGLDAHFGIRPTPDDRQSVYMRTTWDGRDPETRRLQIRCSDREGRLRDWTFDPAGRLDAGGGTLGNIGEVAFADGSRMTSAAGITTNVTVGTDGGRVVLQIKDGRIVGVQTP